MHIEPNEDKPTFRSAKFGRIRFGIGVALPLSLVTFGGALAAKAQTTAEADVRFQKAAGDFLQAYLALEPENATALGEHRYDSSLKDRSREALGHEADVAKGTLKELAVISVNGLAKENRVDYGVLKSNLESTVYEIENVRSWVWNPMDYNVGNSIYLLIGRDFAPLAERLRSVSGRLRGIPAVVAAAEANLQHPPKVHVETAILQNKGTIGLIRDDLRKFADQAPEVKADLAAAQATAVAALEDYGKWLKEDLLPRADGDFRLGDEKFRTRLRYSLESDLSKEEVLRRAEAELKKTQDNMYRTALPIFERSYHGEGSAEDVDRKTVCKTVLDQLAESHPDNDSIVQHAKANLQACMDFVHAHELVSVPSEPVNVVVMPEFQRGVAIAYCDAPGALAKNEATFFAISPTPDGWTDQRKSSFYREYNDFMLQDLTIHEAMPGHYLQPTLANRFKAPTLVRGVFTSGMFAEGWATYAEQFMAESGYSGPGVRMEQLKMRLRLIINAILDQKIHTDGMTEAEAMALMTQEGFQEEGEAAGKWRRACLTAAQLSTYFVGNTEVNDLAHDYRVKQGHPLSAAEVRQMHDQMLSYGTMAPRYLRVLMGL